MKHTHIIFPVHPRTRGKIADMIEDIENFAPKLKLIEPVGYLDMLSLEKNAKTILTDSGGIQKEAYWLKTPCVTLREETEWVETVDAGWNTLVGADKGKIIDAVNNWVAPEKRLNLYGDGRAAEKIAKILGEAFSQGCENLTHHFKGVFLNETCVVLCAQPCKLHNPTSGYLSQYTRS